MNGRASSEWGIVDRSEGLRREGRIHEALELAENYLRDRPDHPRALLLRSRLLYEQGNLVLALEGLGRLGSILGRDQGLLELVAVLEQLSEIRKSPREPTFVTESMAKLFVQQGYLLEAMETYRQLFLSSREKGELWEEIVRLRDCLAREGSRGVEKERVVQKLEAWDRWMQEQERGF
jgi:tetratricopeptide (TPR) repeat protein